MPLSDLAEIVLRAPGIEVHVSPYGATVTKILVPDRDGVVDDVALGYDHLASYQRGDDRPYFCLLYTSPSPRDATLSRMPSSA